MLAFPLNTQEEMPKIGNLCFPAMDLERFQPPAGQYSWASIEITYDVEEW